MKDLIAKLKKNHTLSREEFRELLTTDKYDSSLFKSADEIRQKIYGKDVYIRGLIEFTNYCKNNCYYCGICGEHGGDPVSVEFCHQIGLDYVSCSPFRVPIARLAAAQAKIKEEA